MRQQVRLPATDSGEFPNTIEFVSMAVDFFPPATPPELSAELLVMVQLVSRGEPAPRATPPPEPVNCVVLPYLFVAVEKPVAAF